MNYQTMQLSLNYAILFEIELQHTYFQESIPQGMRCIPMPETERELKALGLFWKQIAENRWAVFIRENIKYSKDSKNNETSELKKALREKIGNHPGIFSFAIITDDPLFFNYTALPFKQANQSYYYGNHYGNHSSSRETTTVSIRTVTCLDSSDGSLKTPILMNDWAALYTFINQQKDNSTFSIEHIIGGQVINKTKHENINDFLKRFETSTKDRQEGWYYITYITPPIDNQNLNYYKSTLHFTPLAYLDVYYNDAAHKNKELINNDPLADNNTQNKYLIPFEARATYWQYILHPSTDVNISNASITYFENSKKIDFTKNESDNTFTSKVPKVLQANYSEEIQLNGVEINNKGIDPIYPINLPCPTADMIYPKENKEEGNEKEEYISKININL